MAAMYSPAALEPGRWIPGDGFLLQADGAPYRILRRQRFEFLSSRECLIFEGYRALYRPPDQDEWVWDGALRVWVQVYFGPPEGVLRRGAAWLCDESAGGAAAHAHSAHSGQSGHHANEAFNILPEVLDRHHQDDFEIVVLDQRGGRSLIDIQADGWNEPAVAGPFEPAGAVELLRRLIDLNRLLIDVGLCLTALHPDQVMVDANLNLRLRGLPLVAPVDRAGGFPGDWVQALAARAERDLVRSDADCAAARPPGSWLALRWLAAFTHYLTTGRWETPPRAAADWARSFYDPGNPRPAMAWELGLFHRLWQEPAAHFGAVADSLSAQMDGHRPALLRQAAPPFCAAATGLLEAALAGDDWGDVIRLATVGSDALPEIFEAIAAAAVAETGSPPDSAEFTRYNQVLDQVARLEIARARATELAEESAALAHCAPTAGTTGSAPTAGSAGAIGVAAARLPPLVAPLGPPAAGADHPAADIQIDTFGIPRARRADGPGESKSSAAGAMGWVSPLAALGDDLQPLPDFPAFQAALATWLAGVERFFSPAWLEPPLTADQQTTLRRHGPALMARLPGLLTAQTQAAATELRAAAQACVSGGSRHLPQFEQALRELLWHAALIPGASVSVVSADHPVAIADRAVQAVQTAGGIDPAVLARLLSGALQAFPVARTAPCMGALFQLYTALTAGREALAAGQWLAALRLLRPTLDAWPQIPVLQEQWRQVLDEGLAPTLQAMGANPASSEAAVAPEQIVALIDLLQGSAESNARWLAGWLPRIESGLRAWFAGWQRPGGSLAARQAVQQVVGAAFARFDAAAARAWQAQLELTAQRRIDLANALANNRAQAAWGKALALWNSGEAAEIEPDAAAAAAATQPLPDTAARVLRLWLEQTTNAIEQLTVPTDSAALAAGIGRMLAPLHDLLSRLQAPPVSALPTSLTERDLTESILAIEVELYARMLALGRRPADLTVWLEAWASQPFQPQSPEWQALAQPPARVLLDRFLEARAALAEHRLEDVYQALTSTAALPGDGRVSPAPPSVAATDRFSRVVPAACLAALIDAWLEPWQRQTVAAARALARQDLDAAVGQLKRDRERGVAVSGRACAVVTAAREELQAELDRRDQARAAARQRQAVVREQLAAGRLAVAMRQMQALETDWPATQLPPEDLAPVLDALAADLRQAFAGQLELAEQTCTSDPAACLAALQAAAGAMEADPDGAWLVDPAAAADGTARNAAGRARAEKLAAIFERQRRTQAFQRYGGALHAGLTSGALPADAPFWAATLAATRLTAPQLLALAQLPTGAVGPTEWLEWVAATRELFSGRDRADLDALQARLTRKQVELQAADDRLPAAGAGRSLTEQAAALRQFLATWRNGRQAQARREQLAALEAAAEQACAAALNPPLNANWLWRPWVHWQQLRAVRAAAQVIGREDDQAAAEQAALRGWLIRLSAAGLLIAAAVIGLLIAL